MDLEIKMCSESKILCLAYVCGQTKYKDYAQENQLWCTANVNCAMCSTSKEEDIDHLFFACPFAKQCWNTINIQWDLHLNLHGRLLASLAFAILYGDFHRQPAGSSESSGFFFFFFGIEIVLVIASGSWYSRNSPSSKCIESEDLRPSIFQWLVSCVI